MPNLKVTLQQSDLDVSIVICKANRTIKRPSKYPLTKYVTFKHLFDSYASFSIVISVITIPKTHEKDMAHLIGECYEG